MYWYRILMVAATVGLVTAGCGAVGDGLNAVPTPIASAQRVESCNNPAKYAAQTLQILPPNPGASGGEMDANYGQLPGFSGRKVYGYFANLWISGPGTITASVPQGQPPYWVARSSLFDYSGQECFVRVELNIQPGRRINLPVTVSNGSKSVSFSLLIDSTKT